jgi:LuxR family maltose regulon positive regulatory protein
MTHGEIFACLSPNWQGLFAAFQVEVSLGATGQALSYMARIRPLLRRAESRLGTFSRALALAALALESGSGSRCERLLRIAFAIGRREGYVSISFFKPDMLSRLCARALEAGIEVDYARDLIRKRGLAPPPGGPPTEAWPWPVKITTLGRFALRVDERLVEWPRKAKQRPVDLLKLLIAHGGEKVPSHWIVDELWPEAQGDTAASALKTTLHRLRKILGRDDAIQLRDGQLSLNPACVWVDTLAVNAVLEELGEAVSHPAEAVGLAPLARKADRLCGLYRGRFLEDSQLSAAAVPREALHRKFLLAIQRVAAAFEAAGMPDKAMASYERALEAAPEADWLREKLRSRDCLP